MLRECYKGKMKIQSVDALQCRDVLAPSPLYSGERDGVRGGLSSCAPRKNGPSPQPSPPSTGAREPEAVRRNQDLVLRQPTRIGNFGNPYDARLMFLNTCAPN